MVQEATPATRQSSWLKVAVTVVACTACSLALHAVGPEMRYSNPSVLLASKAFVPVMATLVAATLLVLTIVFVRLQHLWPARLRGLRFVAGVAPLWFVGVIFMPLYTGSSWSQELYTGLVDVVVLGLLGLLLGRWLAAPARREESASGPRPVAAAVIALVCLAFRYGVDRGLLGLEMTPAAAPGAVFGWELLCAAALGWFYLMVGYRAPSRGPVAQAAWFAGFVFGLQYVLSALYMPAFVTVADPVTLVVGTAMDLVMAFVAVLVYERFFAGQSSRVRPGVTAALVLALCAGTARADGAHSLSGEVAFTADHGALLIALCTKEEVAADVTCALVSKVTPGPAQVAARRAPFRFERVPAGTWALLVFQDVNGNGKLDEGAFGPAEPTGNHRGARPKFRAPRFDEMAFVLASDLSGVVVQLQ